MDIVKLKKISNSVGVILKYVPFKPNITKKEWGLIKGALRRVFSRSELRQRVLDKSRIDHSDSARPRVKKWSWCEGCGVIVPTYTIDIDHKIPVVPTNKKASEMSANDLVNAIWCDENNLQHLCESCHDDKTSAERKERNAFKKGLK